MHVFEKVFRSASCAVFSMPGSLARVFLGSRGAHLGVTPYLLPPAAYNRTYQELCQLEAAQHLANWCG
jgi:hypothetical protein